MRNIIDHTNTRTKKQDGSTVDGAEKSINNNPVGVIIDSSFMSFIEVQSSQITSSYTINTEWFDNYNANRYQTNTSQFKLLSAEAVRYKAVEKAVNFVLYEIENKKKPALIEIESLLSNLKEEKKFEFIESFLNYISKSQIPVNILIGFLTATQSIKANLHQWNKLYSVVEEAVDKVAHLARLEFDAKAKPEIIKDMTNMLAFVEKLNELNTDNVEPLVYMTDEVNVLREDEVKSDMTQEEALKNAPKKDSDYFKVPKVVEKK